MPGEANEQLQLIRETLRGGRLRKTWDDDDSSFEYCGQLENQRLQALALWNPRNQRECSSSCSSSSDISPAEKEKPEAEGNNSAQGLDMLNLPSMAEVQARQKSWMQIYFRYRIKWHEAKPHLQKMSKEDAYKSSRPRKPPSQPENLKLWTRYVKVSLQRKVPLVNAVRVFKNRIRCPDILLRFTLNSFYRKGCENEKPKSGGPLQPVILPFFSRPDDFPEIKKMTIATLNIFTTTEEAFFDEFWMECSGGK